MANAGKEGSGPSRLKETWELARTVILACFLVLIVRTFLYEPFNIPSGSMVPTLQVGDYIWVSKYSYGYSRFSLPLAPHLFDGRIWGALPRRGDVAVFRYTHDTSIDYVKRIIGLPGDRIQLRGGELYINGQLVPRTGRGRYVFFDNEANVGEQERPGDLYEEHLPPSRGAESVSHLVLKLSDDGWRNNTQEYVVPPGHFFAMGDNRDDSTDSRYMDETGLGFVPMENLVGRVQCVFFSIDARHPFWQIWHLPQEIRWGRLFTGVK